MTNYALKAAMDEFVGKYPEHKQKDTKRGRNNQSISSALRSSFYMTANIELILQILTSFDHIHSISLKP